jgi:hypothetical protein
MKTTSDKQSNWSPRNRHGAAILFMAGMVLTVLAALTTAPTAQAALVTWDGDTTTDWSTGDNWDTGSAPGYNDDITIPDATTTSNDPTKDGDLYIAYSGDGSLTLDANAGTTTVNGRLLTAYNSGDEIIVTINSGATLDINNGTSDANRNVLGNDGNGTLNVSGIFDSNGGLVLGGHNTGSVSGSGTVNINSGGVVTADLMVLYNGSDINGASGTSLTTTNQLYVITGASTLALPATTTLGQLLAAYGTGSTTAITVPDSGGLNVNGSSNSTTASTLGGDGTASLTLGTGATADFNTRLVLGGSTDLNDAAGSGTITMGSGADLVCAELRLYGGSDFNGAAGNSLTVDLGDNSGSGILYQIEGNSTIMLPTTTTIASTVNAGFNTGSNATITVPDGGTLDVNGSTTSYSTLGQNGTASLTLGTNATADFNTALGLGTDGNGEGVSGSGSITLTDNATLNVGGQFRMVGDGGSRLNIVGGNVTMDVASNFYHGYWGVDPTLDLDIDATGLSPINVTATVTLEGAGGGNAVLDIEFLNTPTIGTTYGIIINAGTDAISGTWENVDLLDLTEGTTWWVDSPAGLDTVQLQITYLANLDSGSVGNDAMLTVLDAVIIPEPASLALLGLGAAWLLNRRRGRSTTGIPACALIRDEG